MARTNDPLQMRIEEAKQRDIGKKRARIGPDAMDYLKVSPGDVIQINGRKSTSSLGDLFITAVASITVSPQVTVTAASARPANLPVSMEIVFPEISRDTVVTSNMLGIYLYTLIVIRRYK